jgi:hypothetical protein
MEPNNLNRWGSRHLWKEAATLAYMRQGVGDIRPELLLLYHAQDTCGLPAIQRHGTAYLTAWCSARGRAIRRDVLEHAAGDALAVIWCRRAPLPVSARARELGVRNGTYHELRTVALVMFQTRLHEARVRFASGTIYTRRIAYSKVGSSPPRDPSRAAPGNAQQLSFRFAA